MSCTKNGWTNRDAVWGMDLGEPRKHVLGRGAHWHNPANVIEPFKCGGDVASLSDYFDHVLWSPYGTGQTIIFSSCGFFLILFFLFFLAWSQRSQIGCLPCFYTWCGPSVNLECRSKMCCMQLAENAWPKKSPSGHHRTTLSGYIFAIKAGIDNRKKKLHMLPQYGKLTAH